MARAHPKDKRFGVRRITVVIKAPVYRCHKHGEPYYFKNGKRKYIGHTSGGGFSE